MSDEDKPKGANEQLPLARAWALFLFITVAAATALVLITVVAANLVGALGDAVRSSGPCVEETLSNNISGETCWHPQHRLYEGEARWVCRCEPPSPERK
jgi:hypothetical protein